MLGDGQRAGGFLFLPSPARSPLLTKDSVVRVEGLCTVPIAIYWREAELVGFCFAALFASTYWKFIIREFL